MKGWDYSVLSHSANLCGGPEKYIKNLTQQASRAAVKSTNRKWVKGVVPSLAVLVPLAVKGAYTVYQEQFGKSKSKKVKPQNEDDATQTRPC